MGRKALKRPMFSEADKAVQDQFVKAICEKPGDTVTRLIFADWLADKGDFLWEKFIRDRLWCTLSHQFRVKGGVRGNAEAKEIAPFWVMAMIKNSAFYSVRVTGGFVDTVACHYLTWKANGPSTVSQCPIEYVLPSGWVEFARVRSRKYWNLDLDRAWHILPGSTRNSVIGDADKAEARSWKAFLKDILSPFLVRWARSEAGMEPNWQGTGG